MRLAIAVSLCCATAAPAAPPPTPAMVVATIRAKGAKRTVDELARRGQWDGVMDAIGRGEAAWIALAPRLAPGSDAGNAEQLGIALAFALPRNPGAVLAALDPANGIVLGVDRVCGRPFIEDTEPAGYVAQARAALGRVTDRTLRRAKAACLRALSA